MSMIAFPPPICQGQPPIGVLLTPLSTNVRFTSTRLMPAMGTPLPALTQASFRFEVAIRSDIGYEARRVHVQQFALLVEERAAGCELRPLLISHDWPQLSVSCVSGWGLSRGPEHRA